MWIYELISCGNSAGIGVLQYFYGITNLKNQVFHRRRIYKNNGFAEKINNFQHVKIKMFFNS